jgi:glutamate dehydrogenase
MTDEVAALVLANNYKQTQALSIARRRARERQGEYKRLIAALEASGALDRALEFLPSDEALAERAANGQGLTRPELSVLISYSKIDLKVALLRSNLPDDAYLAKEMETAFPQRLAKQHRPAMRRHRLRREIIATQLANDLVNHMGITFVQRLKESTGMGEAAIAHAYVVVRDLFRLPDYWAQIESLDHQLPAEQQLALMEELMRLGRRATRWFLRNRRNEPLDAARAMAHFAPHVASLGERLDELLEGPPREQWLARYQGYVESGVPEGLARMVAGASHLYTLLAVIDAADATGCQPEEVAGAYFAVGSALDLNWYHQQVTSLAVENNWQALAREAYRDDLEWQQRAITVSILRMPATDDVETRLALWLEHQSALIERWRAMLSELRSVSGTDYAMYAVANRELLDLAQSAARCEVRASG